MNDDPWYVQVLEYFLSKHSDYELVRFTTAKDCLANLYQNPDLITLDYEKEHQSLSEAAPQKHEIKMFGKGHRIRVKNSIDKLKADRSLAEAFLATAVPFPIDKPTSGTPIAKLK